MEFTFERIKDFYNEGSLYLEEIKKDTKEEREEKSRLSYAVKKIVGHVKPIVNKFLEGLRDIEVDHASLDEKKNIIYNNGIMALTPENDKKIRALKLEYIEEYKNRVFEVEPHVITEYPELTFEQEEAFEGFVI